MKSTRLYSSTGLRIFFGCILCLVWCGFVSFFVMKVGGRTIPADFIRPFLFLTSTYCFLLLARTLINRRFKFLIDLFSVALGIVFSFSVVLFIYYRNISSFLTIDDIHAIAQSDPQEVLDFMEYFFPKIKYFYIYLLVCVFFILSWCAANLSNIFPVNKKKQFGILGISFLISVVLFQQLYPVRRIHSHIGQYYSDLAEFHKFQQSLNKTPVAGREKREKGEVYVLVIGESTTRSLMSVYNAYPFMNNTPWMNSIALNENWILFDNAYSHHTHTVPALGAALSTGRALTGMTYPKGENIITLSKSYQIKTVWLTNQGTKGPWDMPVAALGNLADVYSYTTNVHSFSPRNPPDEALLALLDEEIENIDPEMNTLFVIHLMGTHSPYEKRYPSDFEEFSVGTVPVLGRIADTKGEFRLNSYLTSIRYTDSVLQSMFERFERLEMPTAFIYFSDHGEAFDSGHSFSLFNWEMSRIPFAIWLSEEYRQRYPKKLGTLKANKKEIFTNDLIFDLYMGLLNVENEIYDETYDISSDRYSLNLDNAVITNNIPVKNDNSLSLKLEKVQHNLAVHRTNTIYKLFQSYHDGFTEFELDLVHTEQPDGTYSLLVGHDSKVMTGMPFDEYMEYASPLASFMWLDIKNLNAGNAESVYQILHDLDERFGLKSRVLIETAFPEGLTLFSRKGWDTSLYLPWESLLESSTNADSNLEDVAQSIVDAVNTYDIGGVSYDLAADKLVLEALVPKLPGATKLYAWNVKWKWTDEDIFEKASARSHLEKLLITFPSPFNY